MSFLKGSDDGLWKENGGNIGQKAGKRGKREEEKVESRNVEGS